MSVPLLGIFWESQNKKEKGDFITHNVMNSFSNKINSQAQVIMDCLILYALSLQFYFTSHLMFAFFLCVCQV